MKDETTRCPICGAEFPETYVVNDSREIVGCNYCTDAVDARELEEELEWERLEEQAMRRKEVI